MQGGRARPRGWALALAAALLLASIAIAVVYFRRPATPENAWKAIIDATAAKRWSEVESRMRLWLDEHPDDGNARVMLGTLLLGQGREQDALAALERVPNRDGAWSRAQALVGEIEIRLRDAALAERALRAAADSDPAALGPRQRLVYLLSLEQRSQDARATLWEMYRLTEDPRMLVDLVLAIWTSEADVRGIGPELEQFYERTPDDPFVSRAWGLSLLLTGRPREALPCLELAARMLTNDPAGRFALAECRHANGAVDGDITVLGTEPTDPAERSRWWLLRSRYQETWGDRDDVRPSLERAIDANPANREAHFRLGQWLAHVGDTEAARKHLERAEALRLRELRLRREHEQAKRVPLTSELAERLGELCREAGMRAEARAWFQQAIRIDPTRSSSQTRLATLPKTEAPFPFALSRPTLAPSLAAAPTADQRIDATADQGRRSAVAVDDIGSRIGVNYQYDAHTTDDLFIADTMGGGVLLLDYDGDGWQDIYFVNGCPLSDLEGSQSGFNRLYRNQGNGTFEEVTAHALVPGLGYGMGGAVADYDSDGFDDILVTGLHRTILYRNRGDGTFEDATVPAGVASSRWSTAAGFGDFDADGDLDLVVVNYVACSAAEPVRCFDQSGRPIHCSPGRFEAELDQFFRNEGDGTFRDISAEAGIALPNARGLGLAIADFDDDGKLDFYVANDASRDFLFRNTGDLHFDEIGEQAGVAYDGAGRATASMGVVAEDLDGDGRIDLLHTNFINESCTLHRNAGGGVFVDATLSSGLEAATRPKTGFGAVALDVDNDRTLDLFLANGAVDDRPWANSPMAQTPQLFLGGNRGEFRPVSPDAVPYLGRAVVGRGVAAGDLDNDGRVDIVVIHRDVPAAILQNRTRGGHAVGVRLIGTSSSRTPIGARVTCRANGHAATRWLVSGASYLAASDARLWFGLGPAAKIDQLEVRWPSGRVEQWTGLDADMVYDLREGASLRRSPLTRP